MVGGPTDDSRGIAASLRSVPHVGQRRAVVPQVLAAALLGMVWAGRRLRHTYFYFDEWSMIGRVTQLGPVEGATASFNGHLWLFQDGIFRLQALVFGLDSNAFLVAVFVLSLVALHLALAALVARIGVPLVPALMLGGLLTYLGPAAQNFVFAVQVSPTFATAAALGATAIVLGRHPTQRHCAIVSTLLLLSVLFDSGVGLLALALGGGSVVGLWPRRRWWVLAPSALVTVLWYLVGDLGPEFDASVRERIGFAARLLVRGAGAVVGGGAWAGVAVLVVAASVTLLVVTARQLDRAGWAVLVAAGLATTINIAGIAQSRAGLDGFTFFENNRYLQNVAIPLTITFVPAFVACSRMAVDRWGDAWLASRSLRLAMPAVLIGAFFALGLEEERHYADVFIERTQEVRLGVRDIGVVVESGCPGGNSPDLAARALGSLSPQISARLVDELVDRGLLSVSAEGIESVDPQILAAICAP
jgi:hypothetical protein